jgi:hypothetical protein
MVIVDRVYENQSMTLNFYRQSQFVKKGQSQFVKKGQTLSLSKGDASDYDVPSTSHNSLLDESVCQVGDWVKVVYDDDIYQGEVVSVVGINVQVQVMAKSQGFCSLPSWHKRPV